MENFDLKKYLTESYLSENTGQVLVDKVEPRWIIAEPNNINMKGLTAISPDSRSELTYYKNKSNAEKELADLVISAEVKADKLRDDPEWYVDVPGAKEADEEFIKRINNAEVIEVEMQLKITVK